MKWNHTISPIYVNLYKQQSSEWSVWQAGPPGTREIDGYAYPASINWGRAELQRARYSARAFRSHTGRSYVVEWSIASHACREKRSCEEGGAKYRLTS